VVKGWRFGPDAVPERVVRDSRDVRGGKRAWYTTICLLLYMIWRELRAIKEKM
jgi:hypothetical protein